MDEDPGRWAPSVASTDHRARLAELRSKGDLDVGGPPVASAFLERVGWEGFALHDPATGATVVVGYSDSCGTGAPLSVMITAYEPLLQWLTEMTGG